VKKKSKVIIASVAVIALLIAGYFYLDNLLFDGVKPRTVDDKGFKANFFAKNDLESQPAIVLIGGGDWGDYWGQELAKKNYAGLSLPYYYQEGLPPLLEEIPLEYFKKAIDWLRGQPEVDPAKVVVMGASRNAELALLIASYYPESVHGVVAYCPSSVSWSNTVHAFNSDVIKPTWTFENRPVPYIPMPKLKGGDSDTLETLGYWKQGLLDSHAVGQASIQVEKINGPILLFSGLSDEVWPSERMNSMIENRLKNSSFKFEVEHIKYKNAGHLISGNPNFPATMRYGKMMIDGKEYAYAFGGTEEGDGAAQKDASKQVFAYLSKMKDE